MYLIKNKFKEDMNGMTNKMWEKKRLEESLKKQLHNLQWGVTTDDRGISDYSEAYYQLVLEPVIKEIKSFCFDKMNSIIKEELHDIFINKHEVETFDENSEEVFFTLYENEKYKIVFQNKLKDYKYRNDENKLGQKQKTKVGYEEVTETWFHNFEINIFIRDNTFIEFTQHIKNDSWEEISLKYSGNSWVEELQNLLVINKDEILKKDEDK